jgi:hypothetical protein
MSHFPDVNVLAGIAASQVAKTPVVKILKPVAGAILGGLKYDTDKTRYELLPPELMHAVADILTFGAKKYSDRNWELGMEWSRPFGALMRHMWAWWRGDGVDAETGKSHLWHAGCCLAFLIAYEQRGIGKDDRPN